MNLYIMRHGRTTWNEIGIVQGRSSNPLSDFGISQVEQKSKQFNFEPLDIIFCSPLKRTIQTAEIVTKYHPCRIIYSNHLTEIDQGIFTGKSKNELSADEIKQKNTRSHSSMEQFASVYNRAGLFLDELKKQSYSNVLIVTHDIVAIMLENIILEKQLNSSCSNFVNDFDNAEIKHFII